jgi:RNA polymerase sporulation-specific sigma factor
VYIGFTDTLGVPFLDSGDEENGMEEQQLIGLAAQGDNQSIRVLTEQYLPVMLKLRQNYFIKNYDHDDWVQEARLMVYHAALTYDHAQTHSFGAFYRLLLNHRIVDLIRRSCASKRQPNQDILSLALETEEITEALLVTNGAAVDIVHVRQVLADFVHYCSPFEADVFAAMLLGKAPVKIAAELQVDLERVINAIDRCRRKLRQQLAS